VSLISVLLQKGAIPGAETLFVVGGILALPEYDLKGRSDPTYRNSAGRYLLASEVKTRKTFGDYDIWYRRSRGVQTLSVLYAYNAPTLLFTQGVWKLFVENEARNEILTFPYGEEPEDSPHENSILLANMGPTFLKIIAICLLSDRAENISARLGFASTPERPLTRNRGRTSEEQRPRSRSPRTRAEKLRKLQPQTAMAKTGLKQNGQFAYTPVRVYTEEELKKIEEEDREPELSDEDSSDLELFKENVQIKTCDNQNAAQ
jgi:hypothetical protein